MFRDAEIDFPALSDLIDEMWGGTNPACRGHDVIDGDNSRTVWCGFDCECPDE